MVQKPNDEDTGIPVIQIIGRIGVSICFIVVVTVMVLAFFRRILTCCQDLFSKKDHERPDENGNKYELIKKWPLLRYEPLQASGKHRPISLSLERLDSYKNATFEIPGMMSMQTIQPREGSTSGYSTGLSQTESMNSSSDGRVFLDEYVQPQERESYLPTRKFVRMKTTSSMNSIIDEDAFKPELYPTSVRKTHGLSLLGKIKYSLQYEDKTKKKMIMTLHDILNLQFSRGTENVIGLYIFAVLLPERDYRFQSKRLPREVDIKLDEQFTFHSRPHNRDFESRTVNLTVMFVDKAGKEFPYGQARMPLLSHEIYSQVPMDISIGIKPCPPHNEIGDAHILLSYSSEQEKLSVMVKTAKFLNAGVLDNLNSVHIKAHLTRVGGQRFGKKRHVSKSVVSTCASSMVDFQDELMTFKLETENFMLCTLKLNLHGKHKIMGKHLSLGKIRIGDNNRDEGGRVHWKTVLNAEGIGWTMWHPIYNS